MKSKIGLCGFMFLIMFALKLAGPMAGASWWLVTLPLYGPIILVIVISAITLYAASKVGR